jgi:hypothetical protein
MPGCRDAGVPRCRGAAHGNNVETLHPVETSHVWCVFYFRRTKSFHANGRPGPDGPGRCPVHCPQGHHASLKLTALSHRSMAGRFTRRSREKSRSVHHASTAMDGSSPTGVARGFLACKRSVILRWPCGSTLHCRAKHGRNHHDRSGSLVLRLRSSLPELLSLATRGRGSAWVSISPMRRSAERRRTRATVACHGSGFGSSRRLIKRQFSFQVLLAQGSAL